MKKWLLVAALIGSCKSKPEFIYLNKLSGKTTESYDPETKTHEYMYIETILIDNAPQDIDSSFALQKAYFEKHNKICLLDSSISSYRMQFYRKTRCTKYFIKNAEDPGGFSSNYIDDCEASEYYFIYTRDEKASNMWVANMEKERYAFEYHDTIYCDYKKNPPLKSLPDIPYNE